MGSLQYDGVIVQFEDRLLTHLQIVIVQKLRRGESFMMSWKDSDEVGDGRSAIWLHPVQPLYFKFFGSRPPMINKEWLETHTASANSSEDWWSPRSWKTATADPRGWRQRNPFIALTALRTRKRTTRNGRL